MGTFSGGFMVDPATGRPVAGATVRVSEFGTDAPVTPTMGPVATGVHGGYQPFHVEGVDAVTLRAGDVEQVLVSVEQQLEKIDASGVKTVNGQSPDASGNVTIEAGGVDIQVGGTQPASGWWLDNGQPIPGIPVTPTGPTWTDDLENGGGSWLTPTETGITYSPASGTATSGQTITVNAFAQVGYELQGQTSWTHTFPMAPPAPPVILDTFTRVVAETNGGEMGVSDSGHPWSRSGTGASEVDGSRLILTNAARHWIGPAAVWNIDVSVDMNTISGGTGGGAGPALYLGNTTHFLRLYYESVTGEIRATKHDGGLVNLGYFGSGLPSTLTVRAVVASADGKSGSLTVYSGATELGTTNFTFTNDRGKSVGLGGVGTGKYAFDNLTVTEVS